MGVKSEIFDLNNVKAGRIKRGSERKSINTK